MNADRALLEQQIDDAIVNYEQQRKENRRRSVNVAVINASMAAITTVLIGLSSTWQSASRVLSSLAIVTSALVMIVSGWDRLYNHKKLWMIYTEKWVLMRELKADISHLAKTTPTDQDAINDIYNRYKKLIRDLNDQWIVMKSGDKD